MANAAHAPLGAEQTPKRPGAPTHAQTGSGGLPETHHEAASDSGHAWRTQPAFDEPRPDLAEVPTPTLDEMAKAPGATQTLYKVVYERVGRRGGRDGSPPPAPFTAWAMSADNLAEAVAKDTRRYLMSRDTEVLVDLEKMTGFIVAGFNNAGTFTIEALHVAQAGETR